MRAFGLLAATLVLWLGAVTVLSPADKRAPALLVESSIGTAIDPLGPGGDVRVFVFVRRDCPIVNRYAPELSRLRWAFIARNAPRPVVHFWLVYVDRHDTAAGIEHHQREYALHFPWVIDRKHHLAARAGATVTPEAAVYSPWRNGRRDLLYRGRIDDRVAELGRERPAATTHDLRDAIEAALEGRMPAPAGGPAVGCFIADAG